MSAPWPGLTALKTAYSPALSAWGAYPLGAPVWSMSAYQKPPARAPMVLPSRVGDADDAVAVAKPATTPTSDLRIGSLQKSEKRVWEIVPKRAQKRACKKTKDERACTGGKRKLVDSTNKINRGKSRTSPTRKTTYLAPCRISSLLSFLREFQSTGESVVPRVPTRNS